jgi:hypothetical protein
MTLYTTSVARQHIPNTHQWTYWEAVFSTQFVLRCYKRIISGVCSVDLSKVKSLVSCETVAGQ